MTNLQDLHTTSVKEVTWPAVEDLGAVVIDLCARVEALEKRCAVQLMQLSDLQSRHHRLAMQTTRLEGEVYSNKSDHIVEVNEMVPVSSLVDRVANAIGSTPPDFVAEARAALREVAAWLVDKYSDEDDCIQSDIAGVIESIQVALLTSS